MLDDSKIRKSVYTTNLELSKSSLVIQNFGNASSRSSSGFIIKPSGINLEKHGEKDMITMDLNGNKIDGVLNPSSDEPTHRVLYKNNSYIGGVVHTHSKFASAFAQANKSIDNYGTTHSDFSVSKILVTDQLIEEEVINNYEFNTGIKIIEKLGHAGLSFEETPGILSIRHGVFSWGKTIEEAFKNAEIIEYIAELAYITKNINPMAETIEKYISKKHFQRKHGPDKYYGQ